MQPREFLSEEARTELCAYYRAAGAVCSLSTNCEDLLTAASTSFEPAGVQADVDFSIRFWVDNAHRTQPPWPNPYVRGLGHLVFAGFDAGSSMLADLRTRRVLGRFSATMAGDAEHWRRVIFPVLLSVLAGSIGAIELHAACVAQGEQGLILLGPSRSGKSTLAMALCESGFRLLSDDRTFCSLTHGKLRGWALPRPLKLRPEAALWFGDDCDRKPGVQNGDRVFYCEPKQRSTQRLRRQCEPKFVVFLEQQQSAGFRMIAIEPGEARSRMEQDLLAESPEAVRKQSEVFDKLLSVPCRVLQYGGRPQIIAEQLAEEFLDVCKLDLVEGVKWTA